MAPFNTYPVKDQLSHLYIALIPLYAITALVLFVLIFKCCECICHDCSSRSNMAVSRKASAPSTSFKPPSYVQIPT